MCPSLWTQVNSGTQHSVNKASIKPAKALIVTADTNYFIPTCLLCICELLQAQRQQSMRTKVDKQYLQILFGPTENFTSAVKEHIEESILIQSNGNATETASVGFKRTIMRVSDLYLSGR